MYLLICLLLEVIHSIYWYNIHQAYLPNFEVCWLRVKMIRLRPLPLIDWEITTTTALIFSINRVIFRSGPLCRVERRTPILVGVRRKQKPLSGQFSSYSLPEWMLSWWPRWLRESGGGRGYETTDRLSGKHRGRGDADIMHNQTLSTQQFWHYV